MVAPTWAEIDALNDHAREKLRRAGKLGRDEQPFVSLVAKNWTQAQRKDCRNYQIGDVVVGHKPTKQFQRHDEVHVVRKEIRWLIVARGTEEFSVSPRQAGLAWTVCEARPMAVSPGDRLRLRSVSTVHDRAGCIRRLPNGTAVSVQSVNAQGELVLADGGTLRTRQVVHG